MATSLDGVKSIEHNWDSHEIFPPNEQSNKLTKGRWSEMEKNILRNNFERFLMKHSIDESDIPLLFSPDRNSEEGKKWKKFCKTNLFYKELAKGLNRRLFLIYRKAVRMFDKNNYLGRYSEKEDKELLKQVKIHGKDWTRIADVMGRSSMSLSHRYMFIKNKKQQNNGKWKEEEVQRLKEAVKKVAKAKPGKPPEDNICWEEVANIVETRNSNKCREKWLDYVGWEDYKQPWGAEQKVELIKRLHSSGVKEICHIDWKSLVETMNIQRSSFWLSRKFSILMKKYSKHLDIDDPSFEQVITFLHSAVVPDLQQEISEDLHALS